MAIYRAETKCITRSKNHNAVAAAAYRAGQKLTDTNEFNDDAKTYDYSKKGGVLSADIVLPKSLKAADFSIERQELWSHVEQHEVTKADNSLKENARVAREWLLALPHELSDDENRALALEFAQLLADELGVIADCCIHKPTPQTLEADVDVAEKDSNEQHSDPRNIHAHIMFTTRKAHLCDDNTLMFGDKADSELSGQARKKRGLVKETDYIKKVREVWADMVNERLAKHDINLVDHRSYSDRQLDIKPQVHLGSYLSKLEASGEETQRGNYNRDIIQRNELVFTRRADTLNSLTNRADGESAKTEQYLRSGDSATQWTAYQSRAISERLEYGEHQAIEIEQAVERRNSKAPSRPDPFSEQYRASVNRRKQRAAELDESASRYDRETEDYRYEFETATERMIEEVIYSFQTRDAEKFDERQLKTLEDFAEKNKLTPELTGDYRNYLRKSQAFFEKIPLSDNENIIRLLRNPKAELLENEKKNNGLGFSDSALSSPQPRAKETDSAPDSSIPTRSFRP